jgi:hypothetical protein
VLVVSVVGVLVVGVFPHPLIKLAQDLIYASASVLAMK